MKFFVLDVLAAMLLVYAVSLVLTSNFNMGNLLIWILTAAVCAYAIWHGPIDRWFATGPGRVVQIILIAGGVFLAGMLIFVAVSGYTNPATGQERAVIVLGAGLRKDRPSLLLRYRLDKAYEFAQQHPDTLVVTTGGQGRGETVPEGQAMRDYLIEKGLSPNRVLAETKSTSTEENLTFAREILQQAGVEPTEPVAYVSNAFHCYRAGKYARMAGYTNAHAVPAGVPLRSVPTCYLREVFALLYYWVFKSTVDGPAHALVGLLSLSKNMFYKK